MPDDDSMLGQNLVDVRNEQRRAAMSGDQLFTVPPKLTVTQQLIYDYARRALDAREAGILLHIQSECAYCTPSLPCQYATSNGRQVLEALRRKGLLKRDRHHVYRRVDQPSAQMADDDFDFGGF